MGPLAGRLRKVEGWVWEVRASERPSQPRGGICKELLIATKRGLGVGEGAVGEGAVSRLSGATASLSARVRPGQPALLM